MNPWTVWGGRFGIIMLENLGPLSDSNGDHFIAFDTTTTLVGGPVVADEDVMRFGGVNGSVGFGGSGANSTRGLGSWMR
jgi:hypothetical protein